MLSQPINWSSRISNFLKELNLALFLSTFEDSVQIIKRIALLASRTRLLLDFNDSMHICKRDIQNERILHKYFQYKYRVFVLEEYEEGTDESYDDFLKDQWILQSTQLETFFQGR